MRRSTGAVTLVLLLRLVACDDQFDFDLPGKDAGIDRGGGLDASQMTDAPPESSANDAADAADAPPRSCRIEFFTCETVGLHCDSLSGTCVECVLDADCAALGLARCDGAAHRCVQCGLDQDCGSGYACEPLSHTCVKQCREDVDCNDANLFCDKLRGLCIACTNDDECENATSGHVCISGGSRCVACRSDADCAYPTRHCDPISYACVGCRDSRDCFGDRFCSPLLHFCIELEGL